MENDNYSIVEVDEAALLLKREERIQRRKEALEKMGVDEDFPMTPEERTRFVKVQQTLASLDEAISEAAEQGLTHLRVHRIYHGDVTWRWEGKFWNRRASVDGYAGLKQPSHRYLWRILVERFESPFIEERENGDLWISIRLDDSEDGKVWVSTGNGLGLADFYY